MNFILALVYIWATWKWGDWRNWRAYYSTILFFIIGDLLYHYLLYDLYPMWKYVPVPFDRSIGITSTHISLSIMAIKYPCTVLLFLGNLPKHGGPLRLGAYILLWIGIYFANELLAHAFGGIKHYNGWNDWWSLIFDAAMFTLLWLHWKHPLVAWTCSLIFIALLWNVFDVPGYVFR